MTILREHAKTFVGKGWHRLVDKLYDNLPEETYVLQAKEKYGTLRFYVSSTDKTYFDLISEVEKDSGTICEDCGDPGTVKECNGWLKTLCNKCYTGRDL